jgi:predicted DNA-binding WGR domain protein
MINYSILLNADYPHLNIRRSYLIQAGQDLFDNWVMEINYGRIGRNGRKKTILLPDEDCTKEAVIKCLKKRTSATKRIGAGYRVKWIYGKEWINTNVKIDVGQIILLIN